MKSIQSDQEQENQRRKRKLIKHLFVLLDEIDDRPPLSRSTARFPYNLVEGFVGFGILFLEGFIAALIAVALVSLRKPRVR